MRLKTYSLSTVNQMAHLYHEEQKTLAEVAKVYMTYAGTVHRLFMEHGIKTRSVSEAKNMHKRGVLNNN